MQSISDQELEELVISIVWAGANDKPPPEVVLICNAQQSPSQRSRGGFRQTVIISKDQAREVLAIVAPYKEWDENAGGAQVYILKVDTSQRHLQFSLGDNANAQAAVLHAIAGKLGDEGKSAIAQLIAYTSLNATP